MQENRPNKAIIVLIVAILAAFVFPIAWMIISALKPQAQIMSTQHFFSFDPTIANFKTVLQEHKFLYYMFNSLIVSTSAVLASLLIGLPAAYGVAKYRMNALGMVVLVVKIIPGIMFLVPWYIIFSNIQLIDTYGVLIVTQMIIALPYIVWIMIGFFETLPGEIQESGLIDGCTKIGVFTRIVLPISAPGYITASLLAFIHSWNHFLFPVIFSGNKTRTLPVAIFNFISYADLNWGAVMAAATFVTLPVIAISLFTQRFIVSGLSAGAVKG